MVFFPLFFLINLLYYNLSTYSNYIISNHLVVVIHISDDEAKFKKVNAHIFYF